MNIAIGVVILSALVFCLCMASFLPQKFKDGLASLENGLKAAETSENARAYGCLMALVGLVLLAATFLIAR